MADNIPQEVKDLLARAIFVDKEDVALAGTYAGLADADGLIHFQTLTSERTGQVFAHGQRASLERLAFRAGFNTPHRRRGW